MPIDLANELSERRIHLWTSLGVDRLLVRELKGRERLSAPYRFRLQLRADISEPIESESLVGSNVCVRFQLPNPDWSMALESADPRPSRDFCGRLTSLAVEVSDDLYRYWTGVMRPQFWVLGLNRRYRMFSQQTTQQIVTQVLADLPVRWAISDAGKPRNYCVQYGESDRAFVSRLLEEDGLFYFFEHRYDGQPEDPGERCERLVITDNIDQVNGQDPPLLQFDPVQGGNRDRMRIRRWSEAHSLRPRTAVSLDRHFQRPDGMVLGSKTNQAVDEDRSSSDDQVRQTRSMTCYPSGVARRTDAVSPAGDEREGQLADLNADAQADAVLRAQRFAYRAKSLCGSGDVADMSPAGRFRLVREGVPDPQAYYTVQVDHLVRLASNPRSGDEDQRLLYKNKFRCQTVDLPFRPARTTPKPTMEGMVPATVVADPSITDDDVCVDRYGRVKVVFPWQEEPASPSCWIRVSQFWAGPRWGAFFWPRVGHEVLVAFEYGDPDRPVIVGSLYNANNMPPLTLPESKLSSGIHSCSHKGNPLQNTSCAVFHDQAGDEYLQLHSETFECLTSETKKINWSAGEQVSVTGHHWLFGSGSGGGGGFKTVNDHMFKDLDGDAGENIGDVLKELALALVAADTRGTVEIVTGDSDKKSFGRNITSFYGNNIWLGCDPVELLEMGLEGFPLLSALLPLVCGAGGQGNTLIGGTHKMQYGTEILCHRGRKVASAKNDITTASPATRSLRLREGNAQPTDLPAMTASQIAVLLMMITDFAIMIFTKAALAHAKDEHWKGFLKFSEVWSLALLPRLQGIIEFIEATVVEVDDTTPSVLQALRESITSLVDTTRAAIVDDAGASLSREFARLALEAVAEGIESAERRLMFLAMPFAEE